MCEAHCYGTTYVKFRTVFDMVVVYLAKTKHGTLQQFAVNCCVLQVIEEIMTITLYPFTSIEHKNI